MTPELLESVLRDLPRYGRIVKDYPYRKVWRVAVDREVFYLKFYPEKANRWRRIGHGGSLAMREFLRLQWLQKAGVPSARAHSVLMGLNINGERGDAVLIEAIEPSINLLDLVVDAHMRGTDVPNHRQLVLQMIDLLKAMGRAGLGHDDLHIGNFLVREGKLYLIDAYPVHKRGILMKDVEALAGSASGFVTRTDLQRGWNELGPGGKLPARNKAAARAVRKQMKRIWGDNKYFGRLRDRNWSGVCFKKAKLPRRWAKFSQSRFETAQWLDAWRTLLGKIESDQLTVLKRSRSGDVLEGELIVGGKPLPVIVKRPRRKYWFRYINEIGRGARARRAWLKSWRCIFRDIPCAWPLLLMEKRTLGYATDAIIVFEKVKGQMLSELDLDQLETADRRSLFHRCGALLRRLESWGLYHWDAKSTNWIIRTDDPTGPFPVLVDLDGIRSTWGVGRGIERLLRAMRLHPQYSPEDSLNLCRGYAPFAQMTVRAAGEGED